MKRILLILFLLPFIVKAESKNYKALMVKNAPKIDGFLDDSCWQQGHWAGNFIQFEPNSGQKPSQKTKFEICYDENNIYVAIRCFDKDTKEINRELSRRDAGLGDMVAVSFDSYYDKRTAFFFGVTAAGVKNDIVFSNDGSTQDASWDPVWYVKTRIDSLGWTAEMKIPLSQLRFNPSSDIWGLNIIRKLYRNDEMSSWEFINPQKSGWISQFGEMSGMSKLQPKRHIEISPYIMTGVKRYEKETGNPYANGYDFIKNAGLDGKIGITNDFTLDFTINPDFGQVEADPSVVNLTAYETYFREKRPFFIENKNITQFNISWKNEGLFYSRRIGRRPQGYPNLKKGEYMKFPEHTRILGALKFSGKSKDGWSVGVIESLTKREFAKIMQTDGIERKESVEPLTNYFVARVQKDLNKGNSILGLILTSTYRDIQNQNLNFLNKTATTGGFDFTQYIANRKFYLKGRTVFSHITGSTEAMLTQQTASTRYFQRPDADYLHLDSNATSMTGTYASLTLGKSGIKGIRYEASIAMRSPKLELNDLGYLRNANEISEMAWISYQTPESFGIVNSMYAHLTQWYFMDFGLNYLHSGFNLNYGTVFKNFWSLHFSLDYNFKGVANDLLRGGPAFSVPRQVNFFVNASTNERKKLSLSFNTMFQNGEYQSQKGINYGGQITYRPFDKFNMSIDAGYGDSRDLLQYFNEITFLKDYYLFSSIDQKTFNLTFRFELNFTPNLTLQYYGAPFISSADFYDYKIITNPRAANFSDRYKLLGSDVFNRNNFSIDFDKNGTPDYAFSNPNFNFQQFRSNLVLRWEYIPGSVLFVVWSHEQSAIEGTSLFNVGSDLKNLFKIFPTDVLLMKLQYRFL